MEIVNCTPTFIWASLGTCTQFHAPTESPGILKAYYNKKYQVQHLLPLLPSLPCPGQANKITK